MKLFTILTIFNGGLEAALVIRRRIIPARRRNCQNQPWEKTNTSDPPEYKHFQTSAAVRRNQCTVTILFLSLAIVNNLTSFFSKYGHLNVCFLGL
jgi:hypothetical protein